MTNPLSEIFEHHEPAGKNDDKGRQIWFIRGHRKNEVTGECYAWVQNARRVKGEVKEFGVPQRSKLFPSVATALVWSKATVADRVSKLR